MEKATSVMEGRQSDIEYIGIDHIYSLQERFLGRWTFGVGIQHCGHYLGAHMVVKNGVKIIKPDHPLVLALLLIKIVLGI